MAPRRLHEDVERSLKSVIVKPRQKPVKIRDKDDNQATKTIKHVVLEGQSGHDNRCIRVKIGGRDIDYFDGFAVRDDLVSELLPRFRHSVIESLTVANFGGRMKIDGDLMAKFSDIFETVSVSKEASFTEICFAGGYDRCGLMELMNCFDSFKPKNLEISHASGMKLDDRSLVRFTENGITCVSLLHAKHSFTSNGVRGFFFDGDQLR